MRRKKHFGSWAIDVWYITSPPERAVPAWRAAPASFFSTPLFCDSVKKIQRGPYATCSLRWLQKWRSCGRSAHHRAGSRLASGGLSSRCSASTSLRSGAGPSTLAVPWRGSDTQRQQRGCKGPGGRNSQESGPPLRPRCGAAGTQVGRADRARQESDELNNFCTRGSTVERAGAPGRCAQCLRVRCGGRHQLRWAGAAAGGPLPRGPTSE